MTALTWWQQTVFYQIYPRSFADGNGDGIGDFPGIIAKLDYLRDLGIGAIWLSPHYPSPFLDCGYDISDYTAVAEEYGSLDDFKNFLAAAHERNLRVVLDFVVNHTSDQHRWFVESRADCSNPQRDWYVWRDGQDDHTPPNNWASIFGGSAWQHDPLTDQYYYHAFLKEQPDLNWRNPEVKQAMWDVARFWLDLGVDGFRLDAMATIFEHPDLPNHTLSRTPDEIVDANELSREEYAQLMCFQIKQPGLHELMQELRTLVDQYPGERVLIGEDHDVAFYGSDDNEFHLIFNFPLGWIKRLTPAHIRANQAIRLAEMPTGAWPCNALGSHDAPRVWSRFGDVYDDVYDDGRYNDALARLHLALLLTLKGTPFLFNGEEIGMADLELTHLSELRDTAAIKKYQMLTENFGESPEGALQAVIESTRDRCRSPMQWSSAVNGGFSPAEATTWLPVHANAAAGVNVADQADDPNSLLNFYRRLLHLRRTTSALLAGDYLALNEQSEEYLAFLRQEVGTGQGCLVLLNFSHEAQSVQIEPSFIDQRQRRLIFADYRRAGESLELDGLTLAAFEILIVEL